MSAETGRLSVLFAAHIRWYNAEAEYTHRLARGLARQGHEVTMWGIEGSPLLEAAKADGVQTVAGPDPRSLAPLSMKAAADFTAHLVKELDLDIVNAMRSEGYPLIAHAAWSAGARVVRTRADMRPPKLAFFNRHVYRKWTDLVIAANDLLRDELILRLKLWEGKIETVYFGIDPSEVTPDNDPAKLRAELGLSDGDRVVGLMGRLGEVKGQEYVLKAAEKVVEEFPRARFLVIYRDVEQSDKFLPALSRSALKDHFVLAGPRENHLALLSLCEAAVIPSVGSEAHCRIALEWMAAGVPVIGSRVGVIPEIITHGVSGWLVQPRYADTIAQCLLLLLRDPAGARAMGEAGKRTLHDRFTEDKMVEATAAAYRRALKGA